MNMKGKTKSYYYQTKTLWSKNLQIIAPYMYWGNVERMKTSHLIELQLKLLLISNDFDIVLYKWK